MQVKTQTLTVTFVTLFQYLTINAGENLQTFAGGMREVPKLISREKCDEQNNSEARGKTKQKNPPFFFTLILYSM